MWLLNNSPLVDCHVLIQVLKNSPLGNGHVAQGIGEDMHEAPHVLHEGEEKSPCGEGRKRKGRCHVGSLCGVLCVPCRHPSWFL